MFMECEWLTLHNFIGCNERSVWLAFKQIQSGSFVNPTPSLPPWLPVRLVFRPGHRNCSGVKTTRVSTQRCATTRCCRWKRTWHYTYPLLWSWTQIWGNTCSSRILRTDPCRWMRGPHRTHLSDSTPPDLCLDDASSFAMLRAFWSHGKVPANQNIC